MAKGLAPRQAEVMALTAEGLTMDEVGERLGISPRTVERHRQEALRKLGARNTAHGVALWIKGGGA